ncbi:hypothetical protein HK096_002249, partial [Nowakowskiella sp. JEL0078]
MSVVIRAARAVSRGRSRSRHRSPPVFKENEDESALTSTPNIAFNPVPTTTGKCTDLKMKIELDPAICVAGGNVTGRLDLTSYTDSSKLQIGEISVEFLGYEELYDLFKIDKAEPTYRFLNISKVFQGKNTALTRAVTGKMDRNGYWQARKGKTTFPFSFELPVNSPSSYEYLEGPGAGLKYFVRGTVKYMYQGNQDVMFKNKEVYVVEFWGANPKLKEEISFISESKQKKVGKGFGVLEVFLDKNTQVYSAGSDINVEIRVTNKSNKVFENVKLSLGRRLKILVAHSETSEYQVVPHIMSEKTFKISYDPGEERSNMFSITIPSAIRTIRGAGLKLAEVQCFLKVSVILGSGIEKVISKEMKVELPINICHLSSMNAPRTISYEGNNHPQHFENPISEMPESRRSPGGMLGMFTPSRKIETPNVGSQRGRTNETPRRSISDALASKPKTPSSRFASQGRTMPWEIQDDGEPEDYRAAALQECNTAERGRKEKSQLNIATPKQNDHIDFWLSSTNSSRPISPNSNEDSPNSPSKLNTDSNKRVSESQFKYLSQYMPMSPPLKPRPQGFKSTFRIKSLPDTPKEDSTVKSKIESDILMKNSTVCSENESAEDSMSYSA